MLCQQAAVPVLVPDVHHGNGTQEAFEEDDRVLFISIHQDSNYPIGSGEYAQLSLAHASFGA